MVNFLFLETPLVRVIAVNKHSPSGDDGVSDAAAAALADAEEDDEADDDEDNATDDDDEDDVAGFTPCFLGDTRVGTSRGREAVVDRDRSVSLSVGAC